MAPYVVKFFLQKDSGNAIKSMYSATDTDRMRFGCMGSQSPKINRFFKIDKTHGRQ